MVNHEETKGNFLWELGKRISQAAKVFTERKLLFEGSLTNSRGSRVAGRGSRVQSRGRGSSVAVAGPKSRSRVQCRGRGKLFGVRGDS